jgi:transporter family-2 protein
MVVLGGLIAFQPPVNAALGRAIGSTQAVWLSFLIGVVALTPVILFVGGGFGGFADLRDAPWWAFLGGLMGVVYVGGALLAVPVLGAAGVTATTIAGQLTLSLVADRFGWFGLDQRDFDVWRVVGVLLLAAGTFLVVRD